MNSLEYTEWLANESIDPGEPVRNDWRAAMITFFIVKVFAGKKYRGEIKDFLLQFEQEKNPAQRSKLEQENIDKKNKEILFNIFFGAGESPEKVKDG